MLTGMEIVTQSAPSVRTGSQLYKMDWQQAVKTAIRDPVELCRLLELPAGNEQTALSAARTFSLFAPRPFVANMRLGDVDDPLLRQVLPLAEEEVDLPGFGIDPVGDGAATLEAGLLKKYHGRALLITTGACAVHCRYCFRRHFPYDNTPHSPQDWEPALKQIFDDRSIEEVLLSGGDPLMLVDDTLAELVRRLADIPHLRRLRIHTRLPIMIPQRVTPSLILVVHANHPAELSTEVAAALAKLVDAGIVVLNQSVLLRGVNDSLETLLQLSKCLVDLRVMPYYLHQLDRVSGTAHFEVPQSKGLEIIEQLRHRLPGYAVPQYVREVPGTLFKTPLYFGSSGLSASD